MHFAGGFHMRYYLYLGWFYPEVSSVVLGSSFEVGLASSFSAFSFSKEL